MCRIDKYLWAIRVFKTRSDAADACGSGKVRVNGIDAKASRKIVTGDVIDVRKNMITYRFKIVEPVDKRQPAKLVAGYADNITPKEELDKLDMPEESFFLYRKKGMGRPTKKDRRKMDDLLDSI